MLVNGAIDGIVIVVAHLLIYINFNPNMEK